MIVSMNHTRTTHPQDLREAFTSIITMMLGLLRVQGLRGLLRLPTLWLASRELRRIADEFCQLFSAWQAGLPVGPVPRAAAQDSQAAPARPVGTRHRSARRSASRRRPRIQPAPAKPARAGVFTRPYPSRVPQDLPGPRSGILVSARCT